MDEIMRGEATQAQIGGFLVALRLKGETADEIAGCAEAMREHVARRCGRSATTSSTPPAPAATAARRSTSRPRRRSSRRRPAPASRSTATAPSPRPRARRTCSRRSGFELDRPPERIERSIDELGFGFLFAPAHHPAMRHAAPVRRELAARTVFNVLGPLDEPGRRAGAGRRRLRARARPRRSPRCSRSSARGARSSSTARTGSTSSRPPARTSSARSSTARCASARSTRSSSASRAATRPSSAAARPAENAQAIREVFDGADGGRRDAILLNAAGAIAAAGHAEDLREGLELAREAVDSGAAAARLDELARSRRMRLMGFRDALAAARARRDRRGQAALALARRHPSGRRPGALAADYERAGAAAVSVLVDERFGGDWDDLRAARASVGAAAARQGLLLDRGAPAHGAGRRARTPSCSCSATSTTARRAALMALAARARAGHARRGARRRASSSGRSRSGRRSIGVNARDLATFAIDRPRAARARRRASRPTASSIAESGDPHARAGRGGRARRRRRDPRRLGADAGPRPGREARASSCRARSSRSAA